METREQVEHAAGAWVARRGAQAWGPSDEAAFQTWLAESPGNRVAYYRLNAAWQEAGRLKALGAGGAQLGNALRRRLTVVEGLRMPVALAAGIVLAVAIGLAVFLRPQSNSYRTPIGGLSAVPLADGSKVTLNTDSRVRIALTDSERRVELERGEAFFEVAKDARRPFVVVAGERRVVAVGTKFSVMRNANDVRVIVTDGLVRMETGGAGAKRQVTNLAAGSVARAGADGVLVQEKPLAVAEEYLSWRSGFVVFHETRLGDIVAEFNRYNTRRIVIQDPEVAAIHFGGNFRSDNVEGFLRLLQQGFPIEVERSEDRIVLMRNDRLSHRLTDAQ